MKDNLFEMVNDSNDEIPGTVIDEANENNILTFDKPETDNVPAIEKEVINESTQMIPYGKQITIFKEEMQPRTEDALINITKKLYEVATSGLVFSYFHIGSTINSFYQRGYGGGELKRIAHRTGISLDTLHKAIKFAKQYSQEQLEALLQGHFAISWNHIANNLSVAPDDLIETYKGAESPKTFHDTIMNFKKTKPRNTAPIRNANEENQVPDESILEESEADIEVGIMGVPSTPEAYENQSEPGKEGDVEVEDADENEFIDASDEIMEPNIMLEDSKAELLKRDQQMKEKDNSDELEVLNEMLEDFKTELLERDKQKEEDDRIFKEMDKELAEKDVIIERFKEGFKQLTIMVENETSHADLLGMIGGIEFDTIYSM